MIDEYVKTAEARARMLQNKAAERAVLGDPAAAAGCAAAAGELVSVIEDLRNLSESKAMEARKLGETDESYSNRKATALADAHAAVVRRERAHLLRDYIGRERLEPRLRQILLDIVALAELP